MGAFPESRNEAIASSIVALGPLYILNLPLQSKMFAIAVLQLSRNRSVGDRGNALLRLGTQSATESNTINQQDQ